MRAVPLLGRCALAVDELGTQLGELGARRRGLAQRAQPGAQHGVGARTGQPRDHASVEGGVRRRPRRCGRREVLRGPLVDDRTGVAQRLQCGGHALRPAGQHRLEGGQPPHAQRAAWHPRIGVARILDPVESVRARVLEQRIAPELEQGAQQEHALAPVARRDAGQAVEPAAPAEREQQRLGLVVGMVGGRERAGTRLARRDPQQRIADLARPALDALAPRGPARRVQRTERHAERRGPRRAVRDPGVGLLLQSVVHVQREHARGAEAARCRMQQHGGVQAAAEGDGERPVAVPALGGGQRRADQRVNRFP